MSSRVVTLDLDQKILIWSNWRSLVNSYPRKNWLIIFTFRIDIENKEKRSWDWHFWFCLASRSPKIAHPYSEQACIECPNFTKEPKILGTLLYYVTLFSRYFIVVLFAFVFTKLTWQMKKLARKRSINTVSSSVLHMFIKKEENWKLTVFKLTLVHDVMPNIVRNGPLKLF